MRIFTRIGEGESYGGALFGWAFRKQAGGKSWAFKGSLHLGIVLLQVVARHYAGMGRELILGAVLFPWRTPPEMFPPEARKGRKGPVNLRVRIL